MSYYIFQLKGSYTITQHLHTWRYIELQKTELKNVTILAYLNTFNVR